MSLEIQINPGDVHSTQPITQHVHDEVNAALKHWQDRITRVEVHLHDDNGPAKKGIDKRCTLEARPAGQDPIVAGHADRDLYQAITKAAEKLGRAVTHHLERHDELKSAH